MRLRRLVWLVPVALFFLNPALACGDSDEPVPMFGFGAEELRAAVEGTWSLTLTPVNGVVRHLTVRIEQATAAPSDVPAPCGGRTLVKSANACVPVSTMPLQVTMLSGDAAFEGVALSGTFSVTGWQFSQGQVSIEAGTAREGGATRMVFVLNPEGVMTGTSGAVMRAERQPAG